MVCKTFCIIYSMIINEDFILKEFYFMILYSKLWITKIYNIFVFYITNIDIFTENYTLILNTNT